MKVSKPTPCPGTDSDSDIPVESLPPWAQRAQNHLCRLYRLLLKLRGKKAYGAPYKYLGKGIEMPRSKRDRAVSIAVLAIILHDLWIYLATRG